jgi:hypothetical protein
MTYFGPREEAYCIYDRKITNKYYLY